MISKQHEKKKFIIKKKNRRKTNNGNANNHKRKHLKIILKKLNQILRCHDTHHTKHDTHTHLQSNFIIIANQIKNG